MYWLVLSFPVCFSWWGIDNLYIFPYSVNERVTTTEIFQQLSKNAPASSYSLSQTSSDIWFGDMNLALLRTDIADCWLRNEYSVWFTKLQQVVMHWNAILLQLVYSSTIYRLVHFYISNSDEIITPKWSLPKRLLTFSMRYGKIWPHSLTSDYLYLFVWANLCILFIFYFKLSFWNWAESELKCNTGIRGNTPLPFNHIQTGGT